MKRIARLVLVIAIAAGLVGCAAPQQQAPPKEPPAWEADNPIVPLPAPPLGIDTTFADLKEPPVPERVRLGRWLFYDTRLSADGTIACSTCHDPRYAFSEQEPVATGIKGQKGGRKAPPIVNAAWTTPSNFFWDGRADSLETQALGPIVNPIEMGNTHLAMVNTLAGIASYRNYFKEAFGSEEITKEKVAKAIADYERTCMSGNSPYDRWKKNKDESAVSAEVKKGDALFFGRAGCSQCHTGQSFTDNLFHNIGIGWDKKAKKFKDDGRFAVTKVEADRGAFKTPPLRDVAKHPPYMHDGSVESLKDAVEHYAEGGDPNPNLDKRIKPIKLTPEEKDALVKFLEALTGESPLQKPPTAFPK